LTFSSVPLLLDPEDRFPLNMSNGCTPVHGMYDPNQKFYKPRIVALGAVARRRFTRSPHYAHFPMEIPQHRPMLVGGTNQQLLHEYVEASPRLRTPFASPDERLHQSAMCKWNNAFTRPPLRHRLVLGLPAPSRTKSAVTITSVTLFGHSRYCAVESTRFVFHLCCGSIPGTYLCEWIFQCVYGFRLPG
jgi:hypothetical protein